MLTLNAATSSLSDANFSSNAAYSLSSFLSSRRLAVASNAIVDFGAVFSRLGGGGVASSKAGAGGVDSFAVAASVGVGSFEAGFDASGEGTEGFEEEPKAMPPPDDAAPPNMEELANIDDPEAAAEPNIPPPPEPAAAGDDSFFSAAGLSPLSPKGLRGVD